MRKLIVTAIFLFAATLNAQTADQLWADLMAGNKLFVQGGQVVYDSMRQTRTNLANGQAPMVSILSCADSRVPPEIVFQKTLGELFVVRVAGNVDDTFGIASLEYAIAPPQNWTRLVVVLGHSDCGAIRSSLTPPPGPNLPTPSLNALITRIRRSFVPPNSNPQLQPGTIMNINYTAANLANNALIRTVPIFKAYYNGVTGVVERVP